jgi:DNA-binding CsgD family transcriptional regulator
LWQVILEKAVVIHNRDFEIIDRKYGLTQRELEVIKESLNAHSIKDIARALTVGPATIKTHLQHIFRKIGVARRSEILSGL